jgi:D-alanyl-D-alanine carboxypeptidase
MKKIVLFLIILLIMIFLSCYQESSNQSTLSDKLQQALEEGLAASRGKGISAAIILPGGETWTGASGISHGTIPVTPDMRFSTGSIAKMFTATIILQLAEEGILSLDDPLGKWIPESYPHVDRSITLRQLLSHTGGLFDIVDNPEFWQLIYGQPDLSWSPGDIITRLNQPALYPPGTGWNYSSTPGYALLRMMIPRITGVDIPTVSKNRIWAPYGMNSSFVYMGGELPGNIAHCWLDQNGDGFYDDFSIWSRTAIASATGGEVFSTPLDLVNWIRALYHDRTVFSQEILDQMLDFYSPCTGEEEMCAGYGLGAFRFNPDLFNSLTVIGHSGNAEGWAAVCGYLPDYGISMAFMDNTQKGEAMGVVNDILRIAIEHLDENTTK